MAYFVFDLDETLGHLYTPFYYICSLRTEDHHKNVNPNRYTKVQGNAHTEAFAAQRKQAYKTFVRLIAEQEASAQPLGILRPGILDVMREIQRLKESGQAKCVMIYSNNGSLQMLELVRDILHTALGTDDLIRDCVHWYHPKRTVEHTGGPGSAKKTWAVLKDLLESGPCGAVNVQPRDVMFFDDIVHPNLLFELTRATLPMKSYVQVTPFKYKVPCAKLNAIYREALESAGLLTQEFVDYIATHCQTAQVGKPFEHHLELLRQYTGGTNGNTSVPPVLPDRALLVKKVQDFGALFPAVADNNNNLNNNPLSRIQTNALGGKRKTRKGKKAKKARKTRSRR